MNKKKKKTEKPMEIENLDELLAESNLKGIPILQLIRARKNEEIIKKNEEDMKKNRLTKDQKKILDLAGACITQSIGFNTSSLNYRGKVKV